MSKIDLWEQADPIKTYRTYDEDDNPVVEIIFELGDFRVIITELAVGQGVNLDIRKTKRQGGLAAGFDDWAASFMAATTRAEDWIAEKMEPEYVYRVSFWDAVRPVDVVERETLNDIQELIREKTLMGIAVTVARVVKGESE